MIYIYISIYLDRRKPNSQAAELHRFSWPLLGRTRKIVGCGSEEAPKKTVSLKIGCLASMGNINNISASNCPLLYKRCFFGRFPSLKMMAFFFFWGGVASFKIDLFFFGTFCVNSDGSHPFQTMKVPKSQEPCQRLGSRFRQTAFW